MGHKEDLHQQLRGTREAMVWKLSGLSEHDVRRPMTRTGTNLLGLVKHLTTVELLYFSHAFDRPFPNPPVWFRQDAEPNEDMWAKADESREYILDTYARACRHADATIAELDLDVVGHMEWWVHMDGKGTMHQVLAHVVAETQRHLGHADIVRELIDGAAGLIEAYDFLPQADEAWWTDYRATLERAARDAVSGT